MILISIALRDNEWFHHTLVFRVKWKEGICGGLGSLQ